MPLDALYKVWHMPARLEAGYYAADLITEIMGANGSSRLYQRLVKELAYFSNIECYQMGSIENGLLTIEGKLVKGVSMSVAEAALNQCIDTLVQEGVTETELQKAKNKTESVVAFEDMGLMSRANNLAFYQLLGNAGLINTELNNYFEVTRAGIHEVACNIFREGNCNTLRYFAAN